MRRCTGWCGCSTAAPIRFTSARRADPHGDRGHRPRRSARARRRARRGRDLRAARLAGRRAGAREGVLYLACAPKSNAVYTRVQRGARVHRRGRLAAGADAPAQRADQADEELGYGKGYRYAHDEEGAYAAGETLLSRRHAAKRWYEPTDRGARSEDPREARAMRARSEAAAAWRTSALRARIRRMLDINLLAQRTVRPSPPRLAKRGVTLDAARFEALEARAQGHPDAHAGAAGAAQRAVEADRHRRKARARTPRR